MDVSNKQILEKAIQKAIDGGWSPIKSIPVKKLYSITDFLKDSMVLNVAYVNGSKELRDRWHVQTIWLIFNHDFAKALWGEKYIWTIQVSRGRDTKVIKSMDMLEDWQYHLQQMVIAEDPIKYLGDNI